VQTQPVSGGGFGRWRIGMGMRIRGEDDASGTMAVNNGELKQPRHQVLSLMAVRPDGLRPTGTKTPWCGGVEEE